MNLSNFLRSRLAFVLGVFFLLVPSLLHAYLLMPFPGSQDLEAMTVAYYLEYWLHMTRVIGLLLLAVPVYRALRYGGALKRMGVVLLFGACFSIFYLTDIVFSAEYMFREPTSRQFLPATESQLDGERLVVGIEHGGDAKAYPLNYIGYHHKVQDTVGGLPVLVTYCTMCRTARVYSPFVEGTHQEFRLVGARHYNAIIEDLSTGSWWYQETGEAGAGPLKGEKLEEIPYEQVTLRTWVERHPNTLILQPDTMFNDDYADLAGYDRTQRVSTDTWGHLPVWQRKNWVVGVTLAGEARAYDWNHLISQRAVNDSLGGTPIVVVVEDDSASFHVWKSAVGGKVLEFSIDRITHCLRDNLSGSQWNWKGECTSGTLEGTALERIPAYQEYWHAWQNFHKNTSRWKEW